MKSTPWSFFWLNSRGNFFVFQAYFFSAVRQRISILPTSQLHTQWLLTSPIESRMDYLIPTCNILELLLRPNMTWNLALLAGSYIRFYRYYSAWPQISLPYADLLRVRHYSGRDLVTDAISCCSLKLITPNVAVSKYSGVFAAMAGSVTMITESCINTCAQPPTDQTLNLILTLILTLLLNSTQQWVFN